MNPKENLYHEIEALKNKAKGNPNIDFSKIKQAIDFGEKAHSRQHRKMGDLFFIHPVRVATKALGYKLDTEPVIASLLHDVVEDTKYSTEDIKQEVGEIVSEMVEALTKIRDKKKSIRANKESTFQKMLALGSSDFRVILIKLIDRLDNLSDMHFLSRRKQREICQETSVVFVEIAHDLGLIEMEEEFKNLIFKQLYPKRYRRYSEELIKFYDERQFAIQEIEKAVKSAISPDLILSCSLQFVEPGSFLYEKGEIVKILENITIETKDPVDCYKVLGQLHTQFRSVPRTIRDYISNPRANGWRGLATRVIVNGEKVTLNIVTREFKKKNRYGIVTLINEGIFQSQDYKQCLKLFSDVAADKSVRIEDVFRYRKSEPIQVFTPMGELIELQEGATIADFAFYVHSELGLKCIGGITNNVRYPREKTVREGMMITIITSDSVKANHDWMEDGTVVMPKSRREILRYLTHRNSPKNRNQKEGTRKREHKKPKEKIRKHRQGINEKVRIKFE